ncbi:hypothetical protein U5B43_08745 [Campylobacter sp. 9BO]|uniref:phage baseplate plug family protein n=1 Tax=Campylobacter sp. 9BO TaxID=3424759 RepID=UPI003D34A60C
MYLIPTTTDELQTQNFSLYGVNVELTLTYNAIGGVWQFDLTDTDTDEIYAQNKGLSVNAPSLLNTKLPFVLMLIDESHQGLNGVDKSELSNRLNLYLIGKDEFKTAMRELANE